MKIKVYLDIDIDSEKAKRDSIFELMKEYYGQDNVLNTLTLKTEGPKSTVLTTCRGLGIDNDIASAIADMIPFERGIFWSLTDCLEGNEDKGRAKIVEFAREVDRYEGLRETMLLIEGLVSGRSIHASASYVFSDGYLKQNSRMRAPNGKFITAYNMHDSDYCGGLKIDVLTIEALDKIHKAMDLLLEDGVIEDKGSLKANYDAYLHPDVLEYTDPKMWEMLGENALIDAFQFETQMGAQATKLIKPHSITELAVANSLMRLMADDGGETPLSIYARHKANIQVWYKEMRDYGLTEKEIELMEKHLLDNYGVADSQEIVMKLTMDEQIAGFSVKEANKLRKAIAKKKADVLAEVQELFFSKSAEIGCSQTLAEYVWNVQFKRQFGYSFSQNHTVPYSVICLQEMNIAHRYGKIYWNTAVLTINAGANENVENNKTTQYGKIAKAIGNMMSRGENVILPEINTAKFGFSPDAKNNRIIFGLKGIVGINDDVANFIVKHRPFTSFVDFYERAQAFKKENPTVKFGDTTFISLIKAGCFDEIETRSRKEVLEDFIRSISNPVSKLQFSNIPLLNELGLLTPEQKAYELRLQRYKGYVFDKKFLAEQRGKSPATFIYRLEPKFALPFFLENFEDSLTREKDYWYSDDGEVLVKRGSLEKIIEKKLQPFKETVLNSQEILNKVNEARFKEIWDKYCEGDIPKWEMDSICFYYGDHELKDVKEFKYDIKNFNDLSPTGVVSSWMKFKDGQRPRFVLNRIAGTVLDRDKNKHMVSLLTNYGVVTVKFYAGAFIYYDKQLSTVNEDGSKTVDEKSWFKRGTKLLVTGYRREDQFVPKKYKDTVYNHTVQLITEVKPNGELLLKTEREGFEEDGDR